MALGLPLKVFLCVDDDILRLSSTAKEKLMKQWLKAYYLFLNIYIYIYIYIELLCVGEKLACLRTVTKKSAMTQN